MSAFLKQQSVGHRPKKSKVFTLEELERFLETASDDEYLLLKVVLIVRVFGGWRIGKLVSMLVDDVDDRGSVIVVEIPDRKTHKPRTFTIINGSNTVHAIDVFRKYRMLRSENIPHKRLFINYRNKKCTVQPNPEEYTGHSFRRSSATLLADAEADTTIVKIHGGWPLLWKDT
ncbi:Phage integrase domain containing protein [Asbolus verrucosus]|uniref:Phage integrase domain containing protein n=1 Tax=Asbolus verrucosus TaxID=1661398 RepID=A0A482VWD5_ASBVE|nr:Phage integrase domain containing protein [Asbolus verrucosus]